MKTVKCRTTEVVTIVISTTKLFYFENYYNFNRGKFVPKKKSTICEGDCGNMDSQNAKMKRRDI